LGPLIPSRPHPASPRTLIFSLSFSFFPPKKPGICSFPPVRSCIAPDNLCVCGWGITWAGPVHAFFTILGCGNDCPFGALHIFYRQWFRFPSFSGGYAPHYPEKSQCILFLASIGCSVEVLFWGQTWMTQPLIIPVFALLGAKVIYMRFDGVSKPKLMSIERPTAWLTLRP